MFPLYVGTSHFESLDIPASVENRKNQFADICGDILKDQPNSIILGDFNFDNQKEYEQNITAHGFVDIIKEKFQTLLQDEKFDFTMHKSPRFPSWRPDKIIVPVVSEEATKSQQFSIEAVDCQKVGTFALPPYEQEDPEWVADDGVVRTPSDHMALIGDFQLKAQVAFDADE